MSFGTIGMNPRADWHVFPSREALAEELADRVANALSDSIENRGQALLAVSGGSTPGMFFDVLSTRPLAWERVTATLVDERFVPENSPRSNAALVRERLLVNEARTARFAPLYREAANVGEAAQLAASDLAGLPLDVAILGMGTDGHTASFFPDAENLADLLAPENPALVLPVHAASAGEPRLTLPLARLLEAPMLVLHIEGEEKRAVLEAALAAGGARPVSAVFTHARRQVPVYWAA